MAEDAEARREPTGRTRSQGLRIGFKVLYVAKNLASQCDNPFAINSRHRAARRSLEQSDPKSAFQVQNVLAQRALLHPY